MEERQHNKMAVSGMAEGQWHLAVEQRAPQPLVQLWAISHLRPPKVQKRLLRISRIKTVWRLLRLRWQGTSAASQLNVSELLWANQTGQLIANQGDWRWVRRCTRPHHTWKHVCSSALYTDSSNA